MHKFVMDFAALLAGISALPAYAPNPEPLFALVSWILFIVCLYYSSSWWQFVRRGFLFGTGLYGVGFYWLFVVSDYVPATFSLIITLVNIGIVILTCLYPAVIALIAYFFKKSDNNTLLLVIPALWVIGEWLRSWILTGFPLYQLGYAFIDTPLAGFSPIGGELAVTLAAITTASSLAATVLCNHWRKKVLAMLIPVSIFIGGWILQQIQWTTPENTVVIRTLHGTPDQQRKSKRYYTIDAINEFIERSKAPPLPNIVIWPESSIALPLQEVYRHLQNDAVILAKQGTSILMGGYMSSGLDSYNALLLANDPNIHYFKRHLVPFGEYTPQWSLINFQHWLPTVEHNNLSAGSSNQQPINIGNAIIAPIICYELLFSNELRQYWSDTNLLVFSSDLTWFKNTWGIYQLFQISRLRAMESGKWIISSTSYGVTAIVDDKGEIIKKVVTDTPEKWLDASVILRSGTTPYTRHGNFALLFFMFSLLLILCLKGTSKNPLNPTQM